MDEQNCLHVSHWPTPRREAFPIMAARLEAAFGNASDDHDNPGHDATPGYCALCEEAATDDEPLVETTFGLMHVACANSREEMDGGDAPF